MEVLDNAWYGSWRPLTNLTQTFRACHLCTFNVAAIFFRGHPYIWRTTVRHDTLDRLTRGDRVRVSIILPDGQTTTLVCHRSRPPPPTPTHNASVVHTVVLKWKHGWYTQDYCVRLGYLVAHVISIRQINNSLYQNHVHVATHISYPSGQVSYLPDAITRWMWDNVGARLSKSVTTCTRSSR